MASTNNPTERSEVERPFIEQLRGLGWQQLAGDTDVPYLTERESFREVLLKDRLRRAIQAINLDESGQSWLDTPRVNDAISSLERLGAGKLMEANQAATEFLVSGTIVEGDPIQDGGKDRSVQFIDFDHPERNDFLVIDQFRADGPGGHRSIIPDLVLFVNGIPLVVIECKSPASTDPMDEALNQLLRYSNQRDWVEDNEGVERLFHYNQLMVGTCFNQARAGTVGAGAEHFLEWKDTSPVPTTEVAEQLGVEHLSSQQLLIAGMLRPAHLLDLVRNFTLFEQSGGQTIKKMARYQQFRAVNEAVRRLQTGQTRIEHGDQDQRGGIIWHTQGSGKSLTMVFLVRKLRTIPALRRFKVVVVTDRTDLERQLAATARLTGETVRKARNTHQLRSLLRQDGPDLVFAMIQKYQQRDQEPDIIEYVRPESRPMPQRVAEEPGPYDAGNQDAIERFELGDEAFPELNDSDAILVLVDEAHRSQAHTLHANLLQALPNSARIGFTGTPIIMGEQKRTHEIFGTFIDRYTIQQSEQDGATVPILYEGRTAEGSVIGGGTVDQLFEDMFSDRTPEELEAIKRKYATTGNVLEAPQLIAAKASDMLRHYIDTVLPNGFKAQVAATSRLAAVRYQRELTHELQRIAVALEDLDPSLRDLNSEAHQELDPEIKFLVRAYQYLNIIRRLEVAAVISGDHNDEPSWHEWSDKAKQDVRINRFKKPLTHADPTKQDGLALICVQGMLLTGFDAPIEQVLYLDRFMQGHELLQAIARVNRTAAGKTNGFVVDYYGVGRHLKEALSAYSDQDVKSALTSIKDELPKLKDRHHRALAVFLSRGVASIDQVGACVELLSDVRVRSEFSFRLSQFLETLDTVLPRPEGLPYVRDAKVLGFINKSAANLYRDSQLNLLGAGEKVRRLIDEHVIANGIDPKIPPISILDADFAQAVDAHASPRAKASEMEHAARHHISVKMQEDPAYYRKLSERLEAILRRFEDNWDELVEALRVFTQEVRQGPQADDSGLDPHTQLPFLRLLIEENGTAGISPERQALLIAVTVDVVDHIRQEIRLVDFWRNSHAQAVLRRWIVDFLDRQDTVPWTRLEAVADEMVGLAKALHTRLV